MTRDENLETLEYAKHQAIEMHKKMESDKSLPQDDYQLFLFLMECAIENINQKIEHLGKSH